MISALIARDRFKDQFIIGDSNPRAGLEDNRHDDTLVVDKGPVTAAQIHNLILVSVVAANDRVLPGYVITGKSNRVIDGAPNSSSILYCPLKRLTRRRIHAKFGRHLTFQKLGVTMPRGERLG